jgi:hypothetical protein
MDRQSGRQHGRYMMQRTVFDYETQSNVQETSKQSLSEMSKETIAHRYQEYLDALWDMQQPSTDVEVSNHAGHPDPNYFRPRRFELENYHFLIMECNTRQCSVTYRMAKTFWFTSEGLKLVEG